LGDENFRLVVGIAERRGFLALVVNLPVRLLGVAEPHVGAGFEQVLQQLGFEGNLHFGFQMFLLGMDVVYGNAAGRRLRVVVGTAAVPQRNQVHRIVLAHRQQAVFVVFVQIVKQAQVAVGIGGVLGQVGFAEHHLRRFALNAAAVAVFQIDGF
jgi:hypothetical protein